MSARLIHPLSPSSADMEIGSDSDAELLHFGQSSGSGAVSRDPHRLRRAALGVVAAALLGGLVAMRLHRSTSPHHLRHGAALDAVELLAVGPANNCNGGEEMFGGLCYKECALLTDGQYPIRTSAMTCCSAHPCGFFNQKVDMGMCGGFSVSGSGSCPHPPGACKENEEMYLSQCYKKCSILTSNEYPHRSATATCCREDSIFCLIPGTGKATTKLDFNVDGDGFTPRSPYGAALHRAKVLAKEGGHNATTGSGKHGSIQERANAFLHGLQKAASTGSNRSSETWDGPHNPHMAPPFEVNKSVVVVPETSLEAVPVAAASTVTVTTGTRTATTTLTPTTVTDTTTQTSTPTTQTVTVTTTASTTTPKTTQTRTSTTTSSTSATRTTSVQSSSTLTHTSAAVTVPVKGQTTKAPTVARTTQNPISDTLSTSEVPTSTQPSVTSTQTLSVEARVPNWAQGILASTQKSAAEAKTTTQPVAATSTVVLTDSAEEEAKTTGAPEWLEDMAKRVSKVEGQADAAVSTSAGPTAGSSSSDDAEEREGTSSTQKKALPDWAKEYLNPR